MHINDLPIDCLILIFQKFPLQTQLCLLRQVCTNWQSIIEQQICQLKCSLQLFGRSKNITDFALSAICDNTRNGGAVLKLKPTGMDDDLIVDSFIHCDELEMYDFLAALFGQIRTLTVHFCWDSPFSRLDLFLAKCESLQSLTLCGAIDYPHAQFTARLCRTLDKMASLVRLDLLVIDLFLMEDRVTTVPVLASVALSQLEHFSISNYKGDLVSVLEQLSPYKCKSLRLDLARDYEADELMEDLIECCPDLLANLEHFRVSLPDLTQANRVVELICGYCKSLKSLDIQCCSFINFEMIKINSNFISHINQLENLSELRMSHVGIDKTALSETKPFINLQMPQIKVLHLSQVNTWPMDSSSLYVETSTSEHLWRAIASHFPRLESLSVRVKKSSIPTIQAHVSQYLSNLKICKIYSLEDQAEEYFGRHKRYDNSKTKGGKFFSECFFDRINDL